MGTIITWMTQLSIMFVSVLGVFHFHHPVGGTTVNKRSLLICFFALAILLYLWKETFRKKEMKKKHTRGIYLTGGHLVTLLPRFHFISVTQYKNKSSSSKCGSSEESYKDGSTLKLVQTFCAAAGLNLFYILLPTLYKYLCNALLCHYLTDTSTTRMPRESWVTQMEEGWERA